MRETTTKLNRIEQAKLQKDVLDIGQEIAGLSEKDAKSLSFDETLRLKWAGVLHHKPRDGHFLVHIRLSSGALSAKQAMCLADVSDQYGDGNVQITLRQACQIHGILLKNLPEVLERLKEVGLTTMETDGDSIRNITGNPLMGVDPEEVLDTTELVQHLTKDLVGNPAFSNLPQKFKISISGNPHDPSFARMDDIGFVPAVLESDHGQFSGFHVYLGGGLHGDPAQLGIRTDFFLQPEDIVPFTTAVITIFRDHGNRVNRFHSRFKYLLNEMGSDTLCRKIEEQTGSLMHGGKEISTDWCYGTFYGIHPQKQKGLFYAGLHVPCNIIPADDLRKLAQISDEYGTGRLRTTCVQSILLLDIPEGRLSDFQQEEIFRRYPLRPGMFSGYASACTGSDFCIFSPVETRHHLREITDELDAEFPEMDLPFRITMTGCEACCAAPQTADIGIRGGKGLQEGKIIDTCSIYIGGRLGKDGCLGTLCKEKIPYDKLLPLVSDIIRHYLSARENKEAFSHFIDRTGAEKIEGIMQRYVC